MRRWKKLDLVFYGAILLAAVLCGLIAWMLPEAARGDVPATQPATQPAATQQRVPVAVYSQPAGSLAKWAGRGVTVALRYEPEARGDGTPTVSVAQWVAAAKAAGLHYVLQADAVGDWADPDLLGALCPWDEPDQDNAHRVPPARIAADADRAFRSGARLYFVSLDALQLELWQESWDAHPGAVGPAFYDYAGLAKALAPWGTRVVVLGDMYPDNQGRGGAAAALKANEQRTLATLFPACRRGSFVECSDQKLQGLGNRQGGARSPGADEFAAQVRAVAAAGASLVCLFPQCVAPGDFAYDATPDAVAAAIPPLAAPASALAALAPAALPIPPPTTGPTPPPTPPPTTGPTTQPAPSADTQGQILDTLRRIESLLRQQQQQTGTH